VRAAGATSVAMAMLEEAQEGKIYRCERTWWPVLVVDGASAGLVLPVVFTGCARGALDEGTIYHVAVVPEQRSRGFGRLLLGRAADTLLGHGVWRICCDTAGENTPMIRLFEELGWTRGVPIEVPEPH
jgi:GNAT superfamily N-acetyltransferase